VYPLHVFYRERGLEALKDCLASRKNIYGSGQHPVLWPIGEETLKFGIDHDGQFDGSVDDGRTIGFGNNPVANLADINQRMPFVLRAAQQFDNLLQGDQREQIERSIRDIAWGGGVR
jgi:hypothetical protein